MRFYSAAAELPASGAPIRNITAFARADGRQPLIDHIKLIRTCREEARSRLEAEGDAAALRRTKAKELAAQVVGEILDKCVDRAVGIEARDFAHEEPDRGFERAIEKLAEEGNLYAKLWIRLGAETPIRERWEEDKAGVETLQAVLLTRPTEIQGFLASLLHDAASVPFFVRFTVLATEFYANYMTAY